MTKSEILNGWVYGHVPGLSGWAYRGAEYCISCGRALATRIVEDWERSGQLAYVTYDDLCNTELFPWPIAFEPISCCDACLEK